MVQTGQPVLEKAVRQEKLPAETKRGRRVRTASERAGRGEAVSGVAALTRRDKAG